MEEKKRELISRLSVPKLGGLGVLGGRRHGTAWNTCARQFPSQERCIGSTLNGVLPLSAPRSPRWKKKIGNEFPDSAFPNSAVSAFSAVDCMERHGTRARDNSLPKNAA